MVKKYNKNKFYFLWDDGSKKSPKEGDLYYRKEWIFKFQYPFIFRKMVSYKLTDNVWVKYGEYNH